MMRISEAVEGVLAASAIIWTTAMLIPIINLAEYVFSGPAFIPGAESLIVLSLTLAAVVIIDVLIAQLWASGSAYR